MKIQPLTFWQGLAPACRRGGRVQGQAYQAGAQKSALSPWYNFQFQQERENRFCWSLECIKSPPPAVLLLGLEGLEAWQVNHLEEPFSFIYLIPLFHKYRVTICDGDCHDSR